MKTLGSVAAVVAAIREDSAAELERLSREAAAALESVKTDAAGQPDGAAGEERIAEARRKAARLADEGGWQDEVDDLRDRESWFASVAAAGRDRVTRASDPDWIRRWIAGLVREAVQGLPAGACALLVPRSCLPYLDRVWLNALEIECARRLTIEAGLHAAGCIVRLSGTAIAYDNSFEGRERRHQSACRSALARAYEAADGHATREGELTEDGAAAMRVAR